MRSIFIILKKEFFSFRKNFIGKLSLWFFFPLILFAVLGLPLYKLVNEVNGLNYLHWAAPGIWMASAFITTYITSFQRNNYLVTTSHVLEVFLKAPVSIWSMQTAMTLWAVFSGMVQLLLALLLIGLINHEIYTPVKWIEIYVSILPIIIFAAVLGNFFGTWVRNSINATYLNTVIIILFVFSTGIFIPFTYFPDSFISAIQLLPIIQSINAVQDLAIYSKIGLSSAFILMVFTAFLFLINGILFQKLIRR
jgi:ABC-type polysaccharide/polyol phosphate export permease